MIKNHEPKFAVTLMCRALSVSKAGDDHWKTRSPSQRAQVRAQLTLEVKRVFDDEQARSGAPRIAKLLNNEGHRTHRKTVPHYENPRLAGESGQEIQGNHE